MYAVRLPTLVICTVFGLAGSLLAAQVPPPPPGTKSHPPNIAPPPVAPPLFEQQEVRPATGTTEIRLLIPRFGRYTLTTQSSIGVAFRLVDRMNGPGPMQGVTGKQDGRLDTFLEPGEYQIQLESPPKGSGEVTWRIREFRELNPEPAPSLPPIKLTTTTLADGQQRAFWLEIPNRRTEIIEVAGRNLADLRLWQNGDLLLENTPQASVITPNRGKPLQLLRLVVDLNPGLYRLTAYGGPGQIWSTDEPEHPLLLRIGVPIRPEAGHSRHLASPFGFDHWLIPRQANYLRLDLDEPAPATLGYTPAFDPQHPFATGPISLAIAKDSRVPMVETTLKAEAGMRLVMVNREPGKPYWLSHFNNQEYRPFSEEGEYWISPITSSHSSDSPDLTTLLLETKTGTADKPNLLRSQTIRIDNKTGWRRKFNLQGLLTLFIEVQQSGKYQLVGDSGDCRYRLEPFLLTKPANYRTPAWQNGSLVQDLEKGLHVLTIEPSNNGRGILDLRVKAAGGNNPDLVPSLEAGGFAPIPLKKSSSYHLLLNHRNGIQAGMILRKLPLDPLDPLPLILTGGQRLTIPIEIKEPGELLLSDERGDPLPFALDNAAPSRTARPTTGRHQVTIAPAAVTALSYASLALLPDRLADNRPAPPLNRAILTAIPEIPLLTAGQERFFDLATRQSQLVRVKVEKPGLYRLESTGLLAVAGNLRTRANRQLDQRTANGVGRNFLVQSYLGSGEYLLTVTPQNQSTGHLGVRMTHIPIRDGGELASENPARTTLTAGEGVAYRLTIPEAGRYLLRTLSLHPTTPPRLETADGWVIAPPPPAEPAAAVPSEQTASSDDAANQDGEPADEEANTEPAPEEPIAEGEPPNQIETTSTNATPPPPPVAPTDEEEKTPGQKFAAGSYRLTLLPQSLPSRVITFLEKVAKPVPLSGQGPHPLPLNQAMTKHWLEPPGQERTPDRWRIAIPAPIPVEIHLSAGLGGELGRGGEKVATLQPGQNWRGELTTGDYLLEVRPPRPDNHVDYQVTVATELLTPGDRRQITAPARIPLALGENRTVAIESFGATDVKARLLDASGRVVAANDDRTDDWNFLLTPFLPAGRYTLAVAPVGQEKAETEIRFALSPPSTPAIPGAVSSRIGADNGLKLQGQRLDLDPAAPLNLTLPAQQDGQVALTPAPGGRVVISATAYRAQPGLAASGATEAHPGQNLGVTVDAAALVGNASPPMTAIRLWRGDDPTAELPVTLRRFDFHDKTGPALTWGVTTTSLTKGQALGLGLPPGAKRLRLTIPPATAATLEQNGQRRHTFWGGSAGQTIEVFDAADTLRLLPTAATPSQAEITLIQPTTGEVGSVITPKQPLLQPGGSSGLLLAAVRADVPSRLRFSGLTELPILVTGDGHILRQEHPTLTGEAWVYLARAPGLLAAWLEPLESLAASPVDAPGTLLTDPPSPLPLAGSAMRLNLTATQPELLSLAGDTPLLAQWRTTQGEAASQDFANGINLHHFLTKGNGLGITLQTSQSGQLSGTLRLFRQPPVPIREGMGDALMLATGSARLFHISLAKEATIGVGVQANPDLPICRLLDATGRLLGSGLVQRHRLGAGDYYLLVEIPPDGKQPVTLRPVLLGVTPPSGIPDEVIRRFRPSVSGS